MKKSTRLVHKGRNSVKHHGTVNPPIVSSSTLIFPTIEAFDNAEKGEVFYEPMFDSTITEAAYGITGNQTTFALQEVIRDLEGGDMCLLAPTGLAAIAVVLQALLKSGDHLLITDAGYGPTRRLCNNTLKSFGIETTYYDPEITPQALEKLIRPNTKLIFMESPSSLTFEMQDIEGIVKLAKKKKLLTAIDNSWASPLYLSPLEKGIDVSIHAITKYMNGHADLLMGSITANGKPAEAIYKTFRNMGLYVSPYDCYMALRGMRTMNARLEYQRRSLERVIQYLSTVKCVKQILCPSYNKYKGYKFWKRDFTGTTPLFSIVLDKKYGKKKLSKMIDNYDLFAIGASWGGYESLVRVLNIDIARSVTAGKYDTDVIRYYIGLEDVDDIIADLEQGFKRLLK